ncbi:MAG: hypothetical protein JF614_09255 [Acidobacteria bacterium]|nr:hypothetical protein [Acidobacteriota bacterium]
MKPPSQVTEFEVPTQEVVPVHERVQWEKQGTLTVQVSRAFSGNNGTGTGVAGASTTPAAR